MLGSLLVSLGLESGEFKSGLNAAQKELRKAQKGFEQIGKSMAQTGARVSEAVALAWPEVNLNARTVLLLKTKTDRNATRFLTDELVTRISRLERDADRRRPVFRYTSRHSVNERIIAVCERARIPHKSPHLCGRHTFATTAIEAGLDVRTAMEAGGWRSSSVFLERYVHPRRQAGRMVADRLNLVGSTEL
jgi:integrase